jgi:site-specific DNA-cytosine methylase
MLALFAYHAWCLYTVGMCVLGVYVCIFTSFSAPQQSLNLLIEVAIASDGKKAAQQFMLNNHPEIQHIFKNALDHVAATGYCCRHNRICSLSRQKVDWVVGGLSCHPFTRLRSRRGTRSRTQGPEEHPDFELVFETWPAYLNERCPSGWLTEEVEAIMDIDPSSPNGARFLDTFVQKCSASGGGYIVNAVVLDSADWISWPRKRQHFALASS